MEMKKYLGMVKVETEYMSGIKVDLRVKFSDDKAYIEQWMKLYPNCDKLIFDNTPELDRFFWLFQDFWTAVTKEEREAGEKAYRELMSKK